MIGQGADRRPDDLRRYFATLMTWADKVRTLKVRTNADTPEGRRQGPRVRRRGDRPVPHRAHVLRRAAHRRHAEDDPGRRRGGAQGRPRRARAVPEARTSSASSRRWTACRSRSACSTRRCTSSCRTTKQGQAEVARQLGVTVEKVQRPGRAAPRGQPDARLARLPAADQVSRDRRHAGPGDHRGRHRGQEAGQDGPARDHDSAGRRRRGAGDPQEAGDRRSPRAR